MGKFDPIDIIFISLISFYLIVFTVIFILLILKFHGVKGFFRYLLSDNDSYVSENENKVTIEEFIKKKNKSKNADESNTNQEILLEMKNIKKDKKLSKKIFKKQNKELKVVGDNMELTNKEKKSIRKYIDHLLDKVFGKDKKKQNKTVSKKKANTSKKTNATKKASNAKTSSKKLTKVSSTKSNKKTASTKSVKAKSKTSSANKKTAATSSAKKKTQPKKTTTKKTSASKPAAKKKTTTAKKKTNKK